MANCPIVDDDGNPKNLSAIKYEDLEQLVDYEEGYIVEYKGTFDANVKEKLPKIIASFANATGGWIFIGINDDKPHCCNDIPVERSDFSQTISQIIKTHITPIPIVSPRFIENENTNKGVLVIEVLEGAFPPYIANGRVSYRVCSSSDREDPFNADADARVLLELHNKAQRFKEELDVFNRRTIYYPPSVARQGQLYYKHPIFNIYIKALYPKKSNWVQFSELDKLRKLLSDAFKEILKTSCYFQDSLASIIARPEIVNSVDNGDLSIQIFYNGSMKLAVPFWKLHGNEYDNALIFFKETVNLRNDDEAVFIDGKNTIIRGIQLCKLAQYLLENMPKEFLSADWAFCTEFENTAGIMLYFDKDVYSSFVQNYGIPFFASLDDKSDIFYISDYKDRKDWSIDQKLVPVFFSSCGLPFATNDVEKKDSLCKLLE